MKTCRRRKIRNKWCRYAELRYRVRLRGGLIVTGTIPPLSSRHWLLSLCALLRLAGWLLPVLFHWIEKSLASRDTFSDTKRHFAISLWIRWRTVLRCVTTCDECESLLLWRRLYRHRVDYRSNRICCGTLSGKQNIVHVSGLHRNAFGKIENARVRIYISFNRDHKIDVWFSLLFRHTNDYERVPSYTLAETKIYNRRKVIYRFSTMYLYRN